MRSNKCCLEELTGTRHADAATLYTDVEQPSVLSDSH